MKVFPSALLILTLIAAGCGGASNFADSKPPKPQNIEDLQRAIGGILKKYAVPGVGLSLVNKDRVIWAGGVGKADIAADRDVTADTDFRVGSITKGFVALSILKLREQGKIDLNSKLSDLAPEIAIVNPWEATDPVRVVNLLQHTAGFDDFTLQEFYDLNAPLETPLREVFARFPHPQQVRWRPGTRFSYSNPDYGLAGYLVEKISGRSCEDYITENILGPLGMTHSSLKLTPEIAAALAQGYEHDPPQPVPYRPIYLRPAGELKSTSADMARFTRMMLNRGSLDGIRIVSPESIALMETPTTTTAARAGLQAGYGLANYTGLQHPIVTHGHDGGIDGFLSRYAYLPDQGLGYFFSINGGIEKAILDIDDLLFDYLTRGIAMPKPPAPVKLDRQITRWTGFYEFASPRWQKLAFLFSLLGGVSVDERDGTLYRRPMLGRSEALVPVAAELFRTEKEPEASTAFGAEPDGVEVMETEFPPTRAIPLDYVKTNPWWPWTRLTLFALALLLMASSPLFAIIWVPRKLLGRMKGVGHLSVRILPLVTVIVGSASFMLLYDVAAAELIVPDFKTVGFFLGTILFALLTVVSLALVFRSFSWKINRAARIHSLLVASASFGMAAYFGYWGMIGFRFWTW